MPNKVDRIRRLRLALEAIAQGTEQPAAGQIASEALDTDNFLAENAQNVVDDQKEPKRQPNAPGAPMTPGNMRELGVRSLAVTCELCHHEAVQPADR